MIRAIMDWLLSFFGTFAVSFFCAGFIIIILAVLKNKVLLQSKEGFSWKRFLKKVISNLGFFLALFVIADLFFSPFASGSIFQILLGNLKVDLFWGLVVGCALAETLHGSLLKEIISQGKEG